VKPSALSHLGFALAPVAGTSAVLRADLNGSVAEHGVKTGGVILDIGDKSGIYAAAGKHAVLMRAKTAEATRLSPSQSATPKQKQLTASARCKSAVQNEIRERLTSRIRISL
jgi:hypothetical protein